MTHFSPDADATKPERFDTGTGSGADTEAITTSTATTTDNTTSTNLERDDASTTNTGDAAGEAGLSSDARKDVQGEDASGMEDCNNTVGDADDGLSPAMLEALAEANIPFQPASEEQDSEVSDADTPFSLRLQPEAEAQLGGPLVLNVQMNVDRPVASEDINTTDGRKEDPLLAWVRQCLSAANNTPTYTVLKSDALERFESDSWAHHKETIKDMLAAASLDAGIANAKGEDGETANADVSRDTEGSHDGSDDENDALNINRELGADINLQVESNTHLMIKLQVLQGDSEEVIKLCRLAVVEGMSEYMVHLLLTTDSVYILVPGNDDQGQYEVEAILSFSQLQSLGITFHGQGFRLFAQRGNREASWYFLSGDEAVTRAITAAIRKAARAAKCLPPPPVTSEDSRRQRAIQTLLETQDDAEEVARYTFAYFAVEHGRLESEVVHESTLYIKDAGFLSTTWDPQHFVVKGQYCVQYVSKDDTEAKSTFNLQSKDFFCRKVSGEEKQHCFEMGNAAGSVVLACHTKAKLRQWLAILHQVSTCVIGPSATCPQTNSGLQWILCSVILTGDNLYICREDYNSCELRCVNFSRKTCDV